MKRHLLVVLAVALVLAAPASLQAQTARSDAEAIRDRELQKEAERRAEVLRAEEGLSDLEASRASLSTLESLTKDISSRMNSLLGSDEGKAVASHRPSLEAFTRLRARFEENAPSDSELSLWRKTLGIYTDVFKARAKKGGALPLDPKEKSELYQARSKVDSRLGLLSECAVSLDGILATTRALPPLDFAKVPTLAEKLTQFEAARIKAENEIVSEARSEGEKEGRLALFDAAKQARIEEELSRARREQAETANALKRLEELWEVREREKDQRHQEELTEMRAAIERAEAADKEKEHQIDVEVKKRMAEAEARYRKELAKLEQEKKDLELQLKEIEVKGAVVRDEKERNLVLEDLTNKALDPHIKTCLGPLTEEGRWQPGLGNTLTKGPISLKALRGFGALDTNKDGLQKLANVLINKQDGERTRWTLTSGPALFNKANVTFLEHAQEIQKHINELGPGLVKAKLLAE